MTVQNLTNEQRKELSNKRIPMDLNIWEVVVIRKLRKYHHSKIMVQVIDDIPMRCEEVGSEMIEQGGDFFELLGDIVKQGKK